MNSRRVKAAVVFAACAVAIGGGAGFRRVTESLSVLMMTSATMLEDVAVAARGTVINIEWP